MPQKTDCAAKARSVHLLQAAERALDDPVKLARAVRIVRRALARQRLTVDQLVEGGSNDAA